MGFISNQKGHFTAVYTKSAQPDYKGTLRSGKSIVFEAKHTDDDRIKQNRLTEAQFESLEKHFRLNAAVFVFVSFRMQKFYMIPWTVWRDMKDVYGRKYIKEEEVIQFAVESQGFIRFLD